MSLSLRSFHVFFIAVSILLSAWVGVWGIASFRAGEGASGLALSGLFFLVGIVLLVYWVRVRRKFRAMGPED
ncbi:MAG TPA: hypothetical protein VOA87_20325 [Thermoanaerobaculia bacterium]|nr:hypothetical protein [Thermoanaerobaculia bacterium]